MFRKPITGYLYIPPALRCSAAIPRKRFRRILPSPETTSITPILRLFGDFRYLVGGFFELVFQLHARRKDDAGFDTFGVKSFFGVRAFRREGEAHRSELAQLNAEPVHQIRRQAVYEIREHILNIAPRERRTPGNISCHIAQRLATRVYGIGIKLRLCFVLRIFPLHQFYFHTLFLSLFFS